jgi:hypothetical protein
MDIDLSKLSFSMVNRKDVPQTKAKNPNKTHTVEFSVDMDRNTSVNGVIYTVLSLINEGDNSYSRQEEILVNYEQEHYPEITLDIVAELIRLSITKQSFDLGIREGFVLGPEHETIVSTLKK